MARMAHRQAQAHAHPRLLLPVRILAHHITPRQEESRIMNLYVCESYTGRWLVTTHPYVENPTSHHVVANLATRDDAVAFVRRQQEWRAQLGA